MKCSRCGFENPTGFTFCGKCGASLSSVCPKCGFETPPGFAFCGKCGASLETKDALTTTDVDHLRAYLPPPLVEALQFDLPSPSLRLLEQCTTHLSKLIEITCTHLPAYLVEKIVHDPTPGQTGGQFLNGTLLFADISGFTAMSERLSRSRFCYRIGHEGAEEITTIVNRYFSAMLSILREHSGYLIKFGGDALLGLFLEPDSATRAVQAALRMQMAMAGFAQTPTSQGIFALHIKVGIHKGQFFAAQLGTSRGIEYALFGADVNTTAAAESAATPGQVLLDRSTLQAINVPYKAAPAPHNDHYFVVEQIEPSPPLFLPPFLSLPFFPEPTLDSLHQAVGLLDTLIPYLSAGLLPRIASDLHAVSIGGEHRLVAVLFANVHGLGEIADRLGPGHEERIVAAINHYFIAMGNAIHRFGGVINKIDLYDRGDKLLAFFGAPLAHEDDAERAVRAALAMQDTLEETSRSLSDHTGLPDLRLSQQIGISYGYVFAGYVGTSWRHEYTVMGDEVNLAARLMSVAESGSITISSDTRRKAQATFDLEPCGKVRLKGKSDPVPIFSVVGLRAIPEPLRGLRGMRSPLVGREAEWNQLLSAVNQLLSGRGQIVSLIGEAGLGKSRLVAEMRQHTTDGGRSIVRWIEGRCLSYTELVSYWPFQEIVRHIVGIRPDDTKMEAWNKLRDATRKLLSPAEHLPLWEGADEDQACLANFVNLPLEGSEKVRYLDAEALQRRTFVAIRKLIEACAQAMSATAPLVLVLEDIHWIDQASLSLLEYLMPLVNRVPLLLLLLYRPERTKRCWQIHEKVAREFAHCAIEITLRPLTLENSQQLLANLVRLERWPSAMYELVLNRIEGNPLYLEEVIRALIDDRALIRDDRGQWQIDDRSDAAAMLMEVPDTLQGVMMARLDRLEESCRQVAQVSSVVGRVFPFDVIVHVRPKQDQLNQYMAHLQQHEIIRESQRVPELVYTFKHAIMQEVCYGSLLARTRRLYHRKIAAYLETDRSVGSREAESNYPLIAHHAFMGRDWPRALRYQLLAGQRAQQLFANQEAIDHLEKALQSAENLIPAETIEQRQLIHTALGELLITTSQYEHALEHLGESLSLSIERGDRYAQAHTCRLLAQLHKNRSEYPLAFDWIEQGLAALEGEVTETAELMLIAGLIYTRQGDYDKALAQCENALRIAEKLGEMTVLARAYSLLGHLGYLHSIGDMAVWYFQRAFDLYEITGDLDGQAISHNLIANAYFDISQWQKAEHHYHWAREIFDQIGDVYHRAFADNNLGGIALGQGRLDEALAFYQEALRSLERIGGSSYVLGALHMNLGRTFVRRGEVDDAYQHLHTSQEYFEQAQIRDFLPEMTTYFAKAALLSGDLAQAAVQGQQALDLARELSMRREEGDALRVLGEIATAQSQFDQAEQTLTTSLSTLEKAGDEYKWARSQLSLARLYAAQKKSQEALEALDRCLSIFQRLDAALDVAAARALQREIDCI